MKHYRAFGLALSLICLLATPPIFAGNSDKDKDKDKDAKKESSKQSTPAPRTHAASPASSQSGGSHGSSGESHSSHGTPTKAEPSKSDHSTHQTSGRDSNHSSRDASGSSFDRSNNSHDRSVTRPEVRSVDHTHLHEILSVRPGRQEREHALVSSHEERARFERQRNPIHFKPAHRVILTGLRIVPSTYFYRRTVFYDAYSWSAPVYVYRMYPRYGLWDTVFLAFALDHIAEEQYALMLYNHQHDREIQRWMEDSDQLAADNDDLRAQLENMKLQMAKMEQAGVVVDPAYVPADAQDLALSPEVIDQLTSK